MSHSFEPEIAVMYGVNAAILFYNISYWVDYNQANDKNFYDGEYWTFSSIKAFKELFPYLSEKQIRAAIQKLIDNDIIKTGAYNKLAYDRTKWYTLTEKGKSILPISQMEIDKRANGNVQKVQMKVDKRYKPIPDINTDINTDINKDIYTQVKEKFCEICISLPKIISIDKSRKATVKARLKEYSFEDIITVFQKAEKSDFLTGKVSNQGSRPFKASFDWLMKPSNFIKVLEGNYDNRNGLSDFGLVGADERYRGIQIV